MIFNMALERRAPCRNFWNFLGGRNRVSDCARAQKFDPAHGTTPKILISWFQFSKIFKNLDILSHFQKCCRNFCQKFLSKFFFMVRPLIGLFYLIFEFQKFRTPARPPVGLWNLVNFTNFHKKWLKIVIFGSMCRRMAPSALGRCRTSSKLFTRFEL